ncbi:sensor histidine kinase [Kitasatospora sp. NPDC058201]|uniref:sensor histidine kinase n=1 Tax=Streptomycetaceae TaxID=2062 RepID=UPI002E76B203|nr:sensor histidine kinase [Streptomyces sp. BE303]MED7948926.1 sensor histidine kinase [Streptomyces sp. BE303]
MSRAPDEWLRWQPVWDAYFVLVSAAGLGGVLLTGGPGPARRAGAAALLVLLVAAHLVLGRRLIRTGRGTRQALLYQLGVVLVFAAAVGLTTSSALVLFALCAPAFMTTGPVAGTLAVLAMNLVWLGVALAGDTFPGSGGLPAVLGTTVAALSVVLGVWVSQIIRQSTERAVLIRELEAARAELGRVSYEAGRAAEREQVADVVHDTLAQGLSSTIMLLQAAGSALEADPARARHYLEVAEATSRDNLADARALITARPLPEATSASLVDGLRREVDRLRDVHGIDATLQVDGAPDPADTALNVDLLRHAQEALSNVRKHAAAGRVEVVLATDAGGVRLEVHDDGGGFAADTATAGHGLPLMRRRLRQAGGELEVDSAPGEGTSLRIRVPA